MTYIPMAVAFGKLVSMSRKGNCRDDAPLESFVNSVKKERTRSPA